MGATATPSLSSSYYETYLPSRRPDLEYFQRQSTGNRSFTYSWACFFLVCGTYTAVPLLRMTQWARSTHQSSRGPGSRAKGCMVYLALQLLVHDPLRTDTRLYSSFLPTIVCASSWDFLSILSATLFYKLRISSD